MNNECSQPPNFLVFLFGLSVTQCILVKSTAMHSVAYENNRFSSLFVTGDVLRRGMSATQRQKFHTDDVKSVRNPVRSADWSTGQIHCFSYWLRMTVLTDKRQKATKVKCTCHGISNKTVNICGIWGIQSSLEEVFEFCLSLLVDEHNGIPETEDT